MFSFVPKQKQLLSAVSHIHAKSVVNTPGDQHEQEADRVAEQVMRKGSRASTWHGTHTQAPGASGIGGTSLPAGVRTFMEPRFGFDFSKVRVHADIESAQLCRDLGARAFTHQDHIYYGAGQYPGPDALTAHELTHVVQQVHGRAQPSIQRVLEVRPPGRGEASAFDRRQELIDRLNAQSAAIQYHLDGREIRRDIIDEPHLTAFDRQMRAFIERAELVPMRLVTHEDRLAGGARVTADSARTGKVDLDDLMADDDPSFRSDMAHFLTERFAIRNYAHRIGAEVGDPSFITGPEFNRAHRLGKNAEAALLQEMFNDPSIEFNYEETLPNNTWLNNFVSRAHRYQIFQTMQSNRDIAGGSMFVKTPDGRQFTLEDFRAQRAAAGAAP